MLPYTALGVEVEIDRIAREPEAEACGNAGGKVSPERGRAEQHEARRPRTNGVGQHRGVRVRRVGVEPGALGDEEILVTASVNDRSDVPEAIKAFLGKGR